MAQESLGALYKGLDFPRWDWPWRSQLCSGVATLRTHTTAAPSAPPLRPREMEVSAGTAGPAAPAGAHVGSPTGSWVLQPNFPERPGSQS